MQLTCLNARHPFAVRIGSGVGSEHYLALQQGEGESFRRLVMVKKLSSLVRDAARAEMMREIRAAASLSHPNVVQVFGAEKSGGHLLISMEYIRGYGLGELLAGLKESGVHIPLGVFVRLLLQACEALDYAQRARDIGGEPLKLVHRNISPESI
ncbi:MAG: protein kinase, partial [Myxococcota bacterium]|nr:protein kinase [Myxococcota bacterium]